MDLPPAFLKAAARIVGTVGIYVDIRRSLVDAVLDDDPERVAYWSKASASVNSEGGEALRQAAWFGRLNSISALLAGGADVHAGNDTALRAAAGRGTIHAAELLLAAGADVHALDDGALIAAVDQGHTDMVSLLLDSGADIHARREGALTTAFWHGNDQMIKLLLDAGAEVKALHEAGGLALREAIRYSPEIHIEKIRILLAGGADVQAGLDEIREQQEKYTPVVAVLKDWIATHPTTPAVEAEGVQPSPRLSPSPRP